MKEETGEELEKLIQEAEKEGSAKSGRIRLKW